jgi:hypothetical protein
MAEAVASKTKIDQLVERALKAIENLLFLHFFSLKLLL